jgi:hypothetical protein
MLSYMSIFFLFSLNLLVLSCVPFLENKINRVWKENYLQNIHQIKMIKFTTIIHRSTTRLQMLINNALE